MLKVLNSGLKQSRNNVSDLIQQANEKDDSEGTRSVFSEKLKRQSKALHSMLKTEKAILREKVDHFQNMFNELQTNITSGFAVLNLSVENSIEKLGQIVHDHATYTNVSLKDMSLEIQIKMNETETNLAEMSLEITNTCISRDAINEIYEVGENVKANTHSSISNVKNELSSKLSLEISKVTSKLYEIKRKQDSRENYVNGQLSGIKNDVSGLKSRISNEESYSSGLSRRISAEEERKVGCSARLTKKQSYYSSNERIVFDDVIYSHGGGFDSSTGIFTAPKSGTYSFFYNIESTSSGKAHVLLKVREYIKTRAIVAKGPSNNGGNAGVEYLWKQSLDTNCQP